MQTAEHRISPLTLSFGPDVEEDFQEHYFRISIGHVRLAIVFGFLAYGLFGFVDAFFEPSVRYQLWFIRYAIACPSSVICLALSFTRVFRRYNQIFIGATVLWGGFGIVAMIAVAPSNEQISLFYYVGLILVFIYGYTVVKLRFVWATAVGLLIVIAYELTAVWSTDFSRRLFVANNFFFLSANIMGMFACYYIEYHTRRSFSNLHLLEVEKEKSEGINQQLLQEVAQRKRAEEELKRHGDRLEDEVQKRTSELERSNRRLRQEIEQREEAEKAKNTIEMQFRQSQKLEAIGTLAGGIAHDFNNILSAVLGYSALAQKEMPPGSRGRAHLEQVENAATRARELVHQILTFSRQADQERRPLKISSLVKEALKLIRASIPTTIEIRPDIDERCGTVLADAAQIHQVVMNFCTNAYYAMRQTGGILGVSLSPLEVTQGDPDAPAELATGKYAYLAVSDTGSGIDSAKLDRVFEPFYTTKPVGEGTGMGLSIAHGIVASHSGAISVTSTPGEGTTFRVYLPLLDLEVDQEAVPEVVIPGGEEHILFVDDEEALADLGKLTLEELGYKVTKETSSERALESFRANPDRYALVVTDQTMPHMTGIELASNMLALRPNVPILLVTGYSEAVSREQVLERGIRELIMKPLIPIDFARTVRDTIDENVNSAKT
jgi:signal transduction histidine kinase/ActR/RegA family two-component response regulator